MAIKTKHNLKIVYRTSVYNDVDYYKNILNSEQVNNLPDELEKIFTIDDVYCKIGQISGDKEILTLKIDIYKDNSKQILIISRNYRFTPDISDTAQNFIKQGYEYLKTLDEYKDAVDC